MKKNQKTFYLVLLAIFMAIVLVLSLVPNTGFIPIVPGAVVVTIIHIPVLIGIMILPFTHSVILGTTFGIGSFLGAWINPLPSNVPFQNPLISVLPRVLFGLVAFFVFYGVKALYRLKHGEIITYAIAITLTILAVSFGFYYLAERNGLSIPLFIFLGVLVNAIMLTFYFYVFRKKGENYSAVPAATIISTLFHTVAVLFMLSLIKPDTLGDGSFLDLFLGVMSINGLLEIVVAILIVSPVVNTLKLRFPELDRKEMFLRSVKKDNNKAKEEEVS